MSKFYAVARGREVGIYTNWNDTKRQVIGYPRALYKSFKTRAEAETFMNTAHPPKSLDSLDSSGSTPSLTVLSLNKVIMYTDGSCDNSYGGCGIIIKYSEEDVKEYSIPLTEYPTTNNRAELYAVYYGLDFIRQLSGGSDNPNVRLLKIDLYTDSSYSIDALTYRQAGIVHEKNSDLVTAIVELSKSFAMISYHHVYGHQSDELNNRVDILAGIASSQAPQIIKK